MKSCQSQPAKARFRQELGNDMKVIATGGLTVIVAKETDIIQVIAPWLTQVVFSFLSCYYIYRVSKPFKWKQPARFWRRRS